MKRSFFQFFLIASSLFFGGLSGADQKIMAPQQSEGSRNVREYDNNCRISNRSCIIDPKNISFFADFLYWCAEENGSCNDNWAQVSSTPSSGTIDLDVQIVDFDWSPGFRVGMGYNLVHNQWNAQIYYTGFWTQAKEGITGPTIDSPFFGNYFSDLPNNGYHYTSASIKQTVSFNMFDWDLGRTFWVSKALSLRTSFGLKGGWINQNIHTKWANSTLSATENFTNDFWGVGPNGGIGSKWNFGKARCLSLFGDFSTALLSGHWKTSDKYTNSLPQETIIQLQPLFGVSLVVKSFLGIGWETNFHRNRSRFSVRLGYETQFWMNQYEIIDWNIGRMNHVLTLLGGTFDCNLSF